MPTPLNPPGRHLWRGRAYGHAEPFYTRASSPGEAVENIQESVNAKGFRAMVHDLQLLSTEDFWAPGPEGD